MDKKLYQIIAALFFMLGSAASQAATYTLPADAGSGNNNAPFRFCTFVGSVMDCAGDVRLGNGDEVIISFAGTLTINIPGNLDLGNNATINASGSPSNLIINVAGDLEPGNGNIINADLTVSGNITAANNTSVTGGLVISGNVSLGNGSNISGDVTVNGNFNTGNNSSITGSVDVTGDVEVGNGAVVTGDISTEGDLVIGEGATVAGNIEADSVTVDQNSQIVGNIVAGDGGVSIDGNSNVSGNVNSEGPVDNNGSIDGYVNAPPGSNTGDAGETCSDPNSNGGFEEPCGGSGGAIDHFEIDHDGEALTCLAEPITLRACENADCSVLSDNTGAFTLTATSGLNTFTSTGNFNLSGAVVTNLAIPATGSYTLSLTTADSANNPTQCDLGGVDNCAMNVVDTGFVLSSPAEAIAGDGFTITVQAVRTDTNTGACVAALDGLQSVNVAMTCEDPASCLQNATTGVTAIPEFPTTTAIDLTFSGGVASWNVDYDDAGLLDFYTEKTVATGATLVGNLASPILVRPASFQVALTPVSDVSAFAADYSQAPVFLKAGESFSVTVTALSSGNTPTPNYGNELAPQQPSLLSTPSYLLPASGGSVTVIGGWNYQGNGVWAANNVRYTDIGVIALQAQQQGGSYLGGSNITGSSAPIGRFVPAYFFASELVAPSLQPSQDDFTYLGQPLTLGSDFPQLSLEPRNVQGSPVTNYANNLFNFSVDWSDRSYNHSLVCGGDAQTVSFTPTSSAVLVLNTDTDGLPEFIVSLPVEEGLQYSQDPAVATAPFNACLELMIPAAALTDSDDVCAKNADAGNCLDFSFSPLQGTELLDGRLVLQPALGPVNDDLELQFVVEYFNGTAFIPNVRDNSTEYSDAWLTPLTSRFIDFTSAQGLSATDLSANPLIPTTVAQGERQVGAPLLLSQQIDPPLAGTFSWIVNLNDIGLPWLAYAWADECSPVLEPELNPCAPLEFGQFRGNDRIIYTRELGW